MTVISKTATPETSITNRSLFAFALPSAGAGCVMWLVTINWLRFGTDTLMLAPAAVGLLFGAARIWDAISDPLAGPFSDRSRSEFGRRRRWMLISSVPLAISSAAMWAPPNELSDPLRFAWLTVAVLAFYTAQTTVRVPHSALAAELGRNPDERTRLFGARLAGDVAGMLLALVALQTMESFPPYAAWVGLALGIAGGGLVAAGALAVREPRAVHLRAAEPPAIGQMYRAFGDVFRIAEARIILATLFMQEIAWASLMVLIPFASDHLLGTPGGSATYLGCVVVPMVGAIPIWARVARRHGKKRAWAVCNVLTAATFGLLYFAGPGDALYAMGIAAMLGALQAGTRTLAPAVQADLIAADGRGREGTFFATMNLTEKVAAGGAVSLTGVALGLIGIEPGAVQSAEVVQALRLLISLLPGGLILLSALILLGAGAFGTRLHVESDRAILLRSRAG